MVVPDRKALEDWAAEHNLTDDYKSLCQNLKARKYILDELNNTGQKQQVCAPSLLLNSCYVNNVYSSDLKDFYIAASRV